MHEFLFFMIGFLLGGVIAYFDYVPYADQPNPRGSTKLRKEDDEK